MSESTGIALDSLACQRGDRVVVCRNGHVPYEGHVEDVSPQLDIVWVRELGTGERRMLSTDECRIIRHHT